MQSIFRLPWCSEHVGHKMSDKAGLEKMRATPVVDLPMSNKLKRKRSDGADASSPILDEPAQKVRPQDAAALLLPQPTPHLPMKAEEQQTSASVSDSRPPTSSEIVSPPLRLAHHDGHSTTLPPTSAAVEQTPPHPQSGHAASMGANVDVSTTDARAHTSEDVMGLTPLQQVIDNEFNMQILMKHNELRLIEQELGKCQVALEQMRRCEVLSFSGGNAPEESVTAGTGPALAPPAGHTRPSHPAPHGVTDGPYSQPYKHWLIQDSRFDAVSLHSHSQPRLDTASQNGGRSTRNNASARKSFAKPSTPGAKSTETLQSMPNYPQVTSKDKTAAPLVLRRSTDGQLVKLMCNTCNRGNFSSIQGFLNHCRIAHKVDYKSHDAAAVDCGRLLDEQEIANLPAETQSTPAPKPAAPRASTSNATSYRHFVHPLNTSAGAQMPSQSAQKPIARLPVPSLSSAGPSPATSPLKQSAQVPRLSAHFAKHNLGGDLAKAATNAKQSLDLGSEEDLPSPDVSEQSSPFEPVVGARRVGGQGPAGAAAPLGPTQRPPSRKGGFSQSAPRPRPSPLAPSIRVDAARESSNEVPESPPDLAPHLSPHAADSNPGLVSDHEEDDHDGSGSEADEATPPHAPEPIRRPLNVGVRGCSDNMEIDVAVDEDMDESGVVIRRNSMFGVEEERSVPSTSGGSSRKLDIAKGG